MKFLHAAALTSILVGAAMVSPGAASATPLGATAQKALVQSEFPSLIIEAQMIGPGGTPPGGPAPGPGPSLGTPPGPGPAPGPGPSIGARPGPGPTFGPRPGRPGPGYGYRRYPRYGGPYRGWRRYDDAAAAAAILGIFGGMIATQPYYSPYDNGPYYDPYYGGDPVAYCMRRFRSYDPYSRTYLGYDGLRHPCP